MSKHVPLAVFLRNAMSIIAASSMGKAKHCGSLLHPEGGQAVCFINDGESVALTMKVDEALNVTESGAHSISLKLWLRYESAQALPAGNVQGY